MSRARVEADANATLVRVAPHAAPALVDAIARALVAAYAAPNRHYHGLDHIVRMLEGADAVDPAGIEADALRLAILFHDVVYDAKAKDNEAQSAAWAERDLARLGVGGALRERVRDLILATTHAAAIVPVDATKALLSDLDLAILAEAPARYEQYRAAVRREYAHIADATWREGRARVLASFLSRRAIYVSRLTNPGFEAAARANLQRELDALARDPAA